MPFGKEKMNPNWDSNPRPLVFSETAELLSQMADL